MNKLRIHPYMVATPSRRSVSSYVGSLRPPSRRLAIYTLPYMVATPSRRSVSSYVGSLRPPSRRLAIYTFPYLHHPYNPPIQPTCPFAHASTHPFTHSYTHPSTQTQPTHPPIPLPSVRTPYIHLIHVEPLINIYPSFIREKHAPNPPICTRLNPPIGEDHFQTQMRKISLKLCCYIVL